MTVRERVICEAIMTIEEDAKYSSLSVRPVIIGSIQDIDCASSPSDVISVCDA